MALKTYGTMAVDWEQRVDFDRLRRERLARAKEHLERSELGALLCFDMANIRYVTATHIGTWAIDKLIRFCLLPRGDEPIMWDFGSAARHHKLYNPWLGDERSRAGGPACGRRRDRAARARGAAGGGRPGRRRPGADAGRPEDQDAGRDHAPRYRVRARGRRLRRALPLHAAGH